MRIHTFLAALPLLLTLILVACGDDSTGPDDDDELPPSGSLNFSYTGAVSGNFNATGAVRFDAGGDPEIGTWAAAGRDPATDDLAIAAFRVRTSPRGDLIAFLLPSLTGPGEVPICDVVEDASCEVAAAVVFDTDLQDEEDLGDPFCVLTSGSIRVMSLSDDRVAGSFSGTGLCFSDLLDEAPEPIAVTNGTFNVPIVPELAVSTSMSSTRARSEVPHVFDR